MLISFSMYSFRIVIVHQNTGGVNRVVFCASMQSPYCFSANMKKFFLLIIRGTLRHGRTVKHNAVYIPVTAFYLQSSDLIQVLLEPAVHLSDQVSVFHYGAHLFGLGFAQPPHQLIFTPLQEILVRDFG